MQHLQYFLQIHLFQSLFLSARSLTWAFGVIAVYSRNFWVELTLAKKTGQETRHVNKKSHPGGWLFCWVYY